MSKPWEGLEDRCLRGRGLSIVGRDERFLFRKRYRKKGMDEMSKEEKGQVIGVIEVTQGGMEGFTMGKGSGKLGEVGFSFEVPQAESLGAIYKAYEGQEKDRKYVDSVLLACWNRSNMALAKRPTGGMKKALESGDEGAIKGKIVERVGDLLGFLQPVPTGRKGRQSKSGLSAKDEKAFGAAIGAEVVATGAFPTPERLAEIGKKLGIDPALMGK